MLTYVRGRDDIGLATATGKAGAEAASEPSDGSSPPPTGDASGAAIGEVNFPDESTSFDSFRSGESGMASG